MADVEIELRSARLYGVYQTLDYAPPVLPISRLTIILRSPTVIEALKSIVEYYPSLNLSYGEVRIEEPFRPLVGHFEQIKAYRDGLGVEDDLRKELTMLIDFLDDRTMSEVTLERERHARGRCTWNMLWLLFMPGTEVCAVAEGTGVRIPMDKRLPGFKDKETSLRYYSGPPSRFVCLTYMLTLMPVTFR